MRGKSEKNYIVSFHIKVSTGNCYNIIVLELILYKLCKYKIFLVEILNWKIRLTTGRPQRRKIGWERLERNFAQYIVLREREKNCKNACKKSWDDSIEKSLNPRSRTDLQMWDFYRIYPEGNSPLMGRRVYTYHLCVPFPTISFISEELTLFVISSSKTQCYKENARINGQWQLGFRFSFIQ